MKIWKIVVINVFASAYFRNVDRSTTGLCYIMFLYVIFVSECYCVDLKL